MRGDKQGMRGSLTVEAACVMAAVLLAASVMIHEAGRIHDETKGSMNLHEAVEKGRHERYMDIAEIQAGAEEAMGLRMILPSYHIFLSRRNGRIQGKGQGGGWSREIEGREFRPERFLRQITLIEDLGDGYGDKLSAGDEAQLSGSGTGE